MKIVNNTPFLVQTLPWNDVAGNPFLSIIVKGTFEIRPNTESPLAEEQIPIFFADEPYDEGKRYAEEHDLPARWAVGHENPCVHGFLPLKGCYPARLDRRRANQFTEPILEQPAVSGHSWVAWVRLSQGACRSRVPSARQASRHVGYTGCCRRVRTGTWRRRGRGQPSSPSISAPHRAQSPGR